MGDVVVDADGEMIFGLRLFEVVVNSFHHRGGEFFGGEAVAAADHADCVRAPDEGVWRYTLCFVQCVYYVQVQWLGNRS